jgi:hypothetical protein
MSVHPLERLRYRVVNGARVSCLMDVRMLSILLLFSGVTSKHGCLTMQCQFGLLILRLGLRLKLTPQLPPWSFIPRHAHKFCGSAILNPNTSPSIGFCTCFACMTCLVSYFNAILLFGVKPKWNGRLKGGCRSLGYSFITKCRICWGCDTSEQL